MKNFKFRTSLRNGLCNKFLKRNFIYLNWFSLTSVESQVSSWIKWNLHKRPFCRNRSIRFLNLFIYENQLWVPVFLLDIETPLFLLRLFSKNWNQTNHSFKILSWRSKHILNSLLFENVLILIGTFIHLKERYIFFGKI